MSKVSVLVVGAGSRGAIYANYVKDHPEEAEIVAVCEPLDDVRERFAAKYSVPAEMCFRDWRDIIDGPKLADVAIICTQDNQHRDPAIALSDRGYHLLLEKPMAPNFADCRSIYEAVKRNGVIMAVCHVLRYTAFNRKLKEMIDSGIIGKVHNIQILEPVGYWHQAHSFVRGNWRNEEESSFMLLAKACHDLDLLSYFMPSKCKRVSSFGSLSYFTRAHQPEGAADRCTECPGNVESSCPYSALKIYLKDRADWLHEWPANVLTPVATPEAMLEAIKDGPYGRCVYACDNDVVDHQIVSMEYEDGATATFTMAAFNFAASREIYIMGDKGTLRCSDDGIEHSDFLTNERNLVPMDMGDGQITSGHGGGDYWLMKHFLKAVASGDSSDIMTGPEVSLNSHRLVFAAEHARRTGTVVELIRPEANDPNVPVAITSLTKVSEAVDSASGCRKELAGSNE